MNNIFELFEKSGAFHWMISVLGIFSLIIVKLIGTKEFSMTRWTNENIISFIRSVFILSLVVTLSHDYFPDFNHIESYLTGYAGAHIIFKFGKEPDQNNDEKKSDQNGDGKTPDQNNTYEVKPPHTN